MASTLPAELSPLGFRYTVPRIVRISYVYFYTRMEGAGLEPATSCLNCFTLCSRDRTRTCSHLINSEAHYRCATREQNVKQLPAATFIPISPTTIVDKCLKLQSLVPDSNRHLRLSQTLHLSKIKTKPASLFWRGRSRSNSKIHLKDYDPANGSVFGLL